MMRSMTRVAVAGCMALAVLGAVAVLDVGSATADAAPSVSEFAGTYSWGQWSAPITISGGGQITGSGGTLSIGGRVYADGRYSFTGIEAGSYYDDWGKLVRFRSRTTYCGNMELDTYGNIVATGDTGGSFVWLRQ